MAFKRKTRRPRSANWNQIPKENKQWEAFYKAQGLLNDTDFEAFKAACQRDLPLTFRITGNRSHALKVREMMEHSYIDQLKGLEWDGQVLPSPTTLPFYPDRLGWQVKLAKQVIRRNPQFAKFQRFLVVETTVGNVSRQEAVSMIPPLFLDVQPHHYVLDTCASPGSKTAQLIEALHAGDEPTGVVIANDSDNKRAHMLTHQVKRLNSPNVVVVNHDAQMFPNIRVNGGVIKFNRILCDVPCSGDATMRKNVNVWKDWRVGNGIGLHRLQVNITARGIQMLKPGGRLVYSTCSLNPIEDEAVVAQILRQFPQLKLVDVSNERPGLVRSPGVSDWKVQNKQQDWVTKETRGDLEESLFPPTAEEAQEFALHHCMRVYPHQQDTGGFFIAVLEKSEEPSGKRAKAGTPTETSETVIEPVAPVVGDGAEVTEESTKLPRDATTDPFSFLNPENEALQQCFDFYGLENFPCDSFVVRNQTGEPLRSIYYVSPNVRPIILENDAKIKFIYAGLKTFNMQKNGENCSWRIQSEAIQMLYPYASKRILKSKNDELLQFLVEEGNPKFTDISAKDQEFGDALQALDEGCCFMDFDGMVSPLWRGRASVNVMLPKDAKEELLLRRFGVEKPKAKAVEPKAVAKEAAADKNDTEAETAADSEAPKDESEAPESTEASAAPEPSKTD